jgi:hypothetical protein
LTNQKSKNDELIQKLTSLAESSINESSERSKQMEKESLLSEINHELEKTKIDLLRKLESKEKEYTASIQKIREKLSGYITRLDKSAAFIGNEGFTTLYNMMEIRLDSFISELSKKGIEVKETQQ